MLLTDSFELGFELCLMITGIGLKVVVRVRALLMDRRWNGGADGQHCCWSLCSSDPPRHDIQFSTLEINLNQLSRLR